MKILPAVLVCLLLLSGSGRAEEESVYESISGVVIGRLFFSQSERDQLDAKRLLSPGLAGGPAAGPGRAAPGPARPSSAGYIIGRSGGPKVWKDGDFIASTEGSASAMSFPGDVQITRHVKKEEPVADDDP